jgi:transposase
LIKAKEWKRDGSSFVLDVSVDDDHLDLSHYVSRVYVEALNVQGMMRNRRLSKSLGDAGWGMLRNALTYMAERSEGVTALVNPRNTSQNCSGCGAIVEKNLSVRVHRCPGCGLIIDRDVNAARNILQRGLEIGLEQPEYTPVGEEASTFFSEGMQVASMNQEAHPFKGLVVH